MEGRYFMKHLLWVFLIMSIASVFGQGMEVQSFEIDNQDFHGSVYNVLDANGDNCALVRIEHNIGGDVYITDVEVYKREKKTDNILYFYISKHEQSITITAEKYLPIKFKLNQMLAKEKVYVLQLYGSEEFKNDVDYQFEGKGDFRLTSEPAGADISIDGIPSFKEKTPYSFKDFNAGKYMITLEKYRYEIIDTVIVIEKDEKNSLETELSPLFGNLRVTSIPTGCTVLINNQESGVTPLNLKGANSGLDAGIYKIKVKKSGSHKNSYGIYQETIEIISGERVNIEAVLPAQYGSISLSSNNDRTKYEVIDLDSKETIYTGRNIDKLQLLTGSYKIKADNPECLAKSTTLTVTANMDKEVEFRYLESDYVKFQNRKRNEGLTFRDNIYKDNNGDMQISESILGFTVSDSMKTTTPLRLAAGDDLAFLQLPLLSKFTFFNGDKTAITYGASLIGNIALGTGSDLGGWIDLISLNVGVIFLSDNYRARVHFDCDAGLKYGWNSFEEDYEYNNQDITYCSLDFDTEGTRTLSYPGQWVPADLSCTYEYHLGGSAFIMLRAGLLFMCTDGNDYYWYNRSGADAWESDGADKPEQIIGDDLPPEPYLEGFKPYFGIGIRF
jgi:PEGA domain